MGIVPTVGAAVSVAVDMIIAESIDNCSMISVNSCSIQETEGLATSGFEYIWCFSSVSTKLSCYGQPEDMSPPPASELEPLDVFTLILRMSQDGMACRRRWDTLPIVRNAFRNTVGIGIGSH
jgi:hypothetical protein